MKFQWSNPEGAQIQVESKKSAIFDKYLATSVALYKIGTHAVTI